MVAGEQLRLLLAIVLLQTLPACGAGADTCEPPSVVETDGCGPVEQACRAIAERFCCAADDDYPVDSPCSDQSCRAQCVLGTYYEACKLIDSEPAGGCGNGGPCFRSSVDFDACNAALDAWEMVCRGCGGQYTYDCAAVRDHEFPVGENLPAECQSQACATSADGCAEDP